MRAVLLDTCAAISLINGRPMGERGKAAIRDAAGADGVFVSPVTAWEVGMLGRSGPTRSATFLPDPAQWIARLLSGPSIRAAPCYFAIALASSSLPQPCHEDPADRLLVSTARYLGVPMVTSNLPFDEGAGVFASERLTGALRDRLMHHAHSLELNGDSYRLKQSKRRQRGTPCAEVPDPASEG